MSCQSCNFFQTLVSGAPIDRNSTFFPFSKDDFGQCRRHAPKPIQARMMFEEFPMSYFKAWPIVGFGEWCGEYKRKE